MNIVEKLDSYLKNPPFIKDLKGENLIFISDWHMGNGSVADDFVQNEERALTLLGNSHHFITVGDMFERWQFRGESIYMRYPKIVYGGFGKLNREKRLMQIGGNHDADLNQPKAVLLLTDCGNILCTHGNAGDLINDKLWWLGRWFTRYPWKWLEYLGAKDAAGKFKRHDLQRKGMIEWANTRKHLLVAGHIHSQENEGHYWNIGSGVRSDGLEYLELFNGQMRLHHI